MLQARGVLLVVLVALLGLVLGVPRAALAAPPKSPEGRWVTIDDDGKTAKSIVEIYQRGKKMHGKIVQLINPSRPNPKCTECEGSRKNQPIVGMEIIWDLEKDGDEWSGGYILDPDNGKSYRCYLEVVEGGKRLKVRGYIGIALLGRTQYWQREAPPAATKK
jgi:uncharacterized protein (DUF2147 family)